MGTRSTTSFHEDKKVICTIYKQYDGYIDGGLGEDLYKILSHIKIVNGFTGDMQAGLYANGVGCLAAQVIDILKDDIGGVYMHAPIKYGKNHDWTDYDYHINYDTKKDKLTILVSSFGDTQFNGTVEEYGAYIEKLKAEDKEGGDM